MPLPETSQSKMANCSPDLTCMHGEFVELLWDNGPVMQGQSTRPRKASIFTALAPCGGRASDKDGKDNPYPKIGHFRATESKLNSFPGFGINAHDDDDDDDDVIGPWINYPIEDPLHEFLNDYPGINANSIHSQTNAVPAFRSSFLEQLGKDSHNAEQGHATETSRNRPGQPCKLPTQFHSSVPNAKSSEMEPSVGNCSKAHREAGGNHGLMNFSHFTRPVAIAMANLQGVDRPAGNKNNKENVAMGSNTIASTTVVVSTGGSNSVLETPLDQPSAAAQTNRDLVSSPKRPEEDIFTDKTLCEGENSRMNSNPNPVNTCTGSPERIQISSSFAASAALGRHETDKGNEAAVACSSVCSDSSSGPVSNDHNQRGKRKHQEGEESSIDLEDDSVELKKPSTAQGKSKKRSRAAEVHNLSERRRRDRINERMRALQELIPNCNKTDKASMLDEAIDYLRSLQMQVQMMSMGSGFCMPPVMMRAPAMAHFSPMGIGGMGMGIGLSYGMGMYDMNGSPAGCSFIPVSPIQGPQFPCPSIPGPRGLHRVPGSNSLQMFEIPAGQGLPVPMMPYYHPPPATATDTKISPVVAATKSENHLQSKGSKKTQ